jgi:hypothetical protein
MWHGDNPNPLDCAGMSHARTGGSPLANYIQYTPRTDGILNRLAELNPQALAIMHGSSFAGDGAGALLALARTMRDILG